MNIKDLNVEILKNCDPNVLENIKRKLLWIDSVYQPLKARKIDLDKQVNWVDRINILKSNPCINEINKINKQLTDFEIKYNELIDEIKKEVNAAAMKLFPMRLLWLVEDLVEGIDRLRIKRNLKSQDLFAPYKTASIIGKDRLYDVSNSMIELVVSQYGDQYKRYDSKNALVDALVLSIVSSINLPISIGD